MFDCRERLFRRWIVGLTLLVGGLFIGGCDMAPAPVPVGGGPMGQSALRLAGRPLVNEEAIGRSWDVPIVGLDGERFQLGDYRGKVVVVDFWATYCPPCVKQAPQLAELSRRYREQGLEIIGLTSDEKSDQQKVEEFIQRVGINYRIGYASSWISRSFLYGTEDETGAPPIPQLFILSRQGKVVEHLVGDSPQHGIDYLTEVVTRELAAD
jgi:thiol-disulfide isomerase/thioredoxin